MTNLLRAALAATLAAGSLAAQAGTLTMNGWLFGAGHGVATATPNYSGQAGGFKGTLTGMTDAAFNLSPVEMYCVDMAQTININNGTTFSVQLAGDGLNTQFTIFNASDLIFGKLGVTTRLAQLISYAESAPTVVDRSTKSTSLQLAIWNTLHDTDATLGAGTFQDTSAHVAYANDLLAGATGFGISKQLYVMRSATMQDQLFWMDTPTERTERVPEPASLALVGLALAGVVASRRRKA